MITHNVTVEFAPSELLNLRHVVGLVLRMHANDSDFTLDPDEYVDLLAILGRLDEAGGL